MLKVFIKKIILKLLKIFNLTVLYTNRYNSLKEYQKDIVKILDIPSKKITEIIKIMRVSNSELFQEAYVLFKNNFKKKGILLNLEQKME